MLLVSLGFWLSILFMRFRCLLSCLRQRILDSSFNSLYEIPGWLSCGSSAPSSFNSLYEIHSNHKIKRKPICWNFQFSLWDSTSKYRCVVSFSGGTFNSLYEIRADNPGSNPGGRTNPFQFSLWDSITGRIYLRQESYTFNSLYEIHAVESAAACLQRNHAFNSLYEIRRPLIWLSHSDLAEYFQFSLWDSEGFSRPVFPF